MSNCDMHERSEGSAASISRISSNASGYLDARLSLLVLLGGYVLVSIGILSIGGLLLLLTVLYVTFVVCFVYKILSLSKYINVDKSLSVDDAARKLEPTVPLAEHTGVSNI